MLLGSNLKTFLHRHLWRSLPRRLRRNALLQFTSFAAPRPSTDVRSTLPIIVAGALTTTSGLGASARLCHDALKAEGLPVFGIDLSDALMQPSDYSGFEFVDGRSLRGSGTLILHVNSPLVPLAMFRLGRPLIESKRVIGYWAWELPFAPPDWRYGYPFVHEIWVPSQFCAQSMRGIAKGKPVHVLPHPVAMEDAASTVAARSPRGAHSPFAVLTIFDTASSFERKNPLAVIKAFRLAFGDDPQTYLTVKTSHVGERSGASLLLKAGAGDSANIRIIDRIMSASELELLFDEADVVISLHRSEGFGLTLAEAMRRGLAVIATNWSGSADFVSEGTGILISYTLKPANDRQGTYDYPKMQWADPDVTEAAQALRKLRQSPELCVQLGNAGAQFVRETMGSKVYATAVKELLCL